MLRLMRRVPAAKKSIPAIPGQSGVFVRPTIISPVTGSHSYVVSNLPNLVDGDVNTFGTLQYGAYDSIFGTRFSFGVVHPGGKLRIKNKINTGQYVPGGFIIRYSPNLDGSNPLDLYSSPAGTVMNDPVISEFTIPGNIGIITIDGVGGAKYSGGTAEIYDIALEL